MIIDGITTPSGTVLDVSELDALDSTAPKGTILKVEQTHVNTTSTQAITAHTKADIDGITLTITPTSVNSRFFIMAHWSGEFSGTHESAFGLRRNGTDIGLPTGAGTRRTGLSGPFMGYYATDHNSTPDNSIVHYIDSPNTTSPVTYTMTIIMNQTQTLYNNRAIGDIDNPDHERLTSNITVMEIAS